MSAQPRLRVTLPGKPRVGLPEVQADLPGARSRFLLRKCQLEAESALQEAERSFAAAGFAAMQVPVARTTVGEDRSID